ncbi:hypothetical protein [Amycolatopsis sp. NPDC051128]|uniref:hypothetical protein n=1 Tax=Amycolatopsis sp. NPDC051128 TaxID=3155412 RepID=UPI003442B23E
MPENTIPAALAGARPCAKGNPPCIGCGWPTNANGNCFNDSCWNSNGNRHK